ncbi:hypothetical protein NN561_019722 [Cricetulus griseus]
MTFETCVQGVLSSCSTPYHKPNPFYKKLKLEHKQVMWELKELKRLEERLDALLQQKERVIKTKDLAEELQHHFDDSQMRGLNSRVLMEEAQVYMKVDTLRQEKKKLQENWALLKHHLEDLNAICKDQEEETGDLKIQQQQELKRLEERLDTLLQQKEMVIHTKDLAEKLQHHFDDSQMKGLHSQLLMEQAQLHKKVDTLRQEKKKLQENWALLKHHLEDLNAICKDQEEETSDLKIQQQQELKRLEERLDALLQQKEKVIKTKDLPERLQHHFDDSQMRSTQLKPELEQDTAQDESHLQKEMLQQEPPAEPHPHQILNS